MQAIDAAVFTPGYWFTIKKSLANLEGSPCAFTARLLHYSTQMHLINRGGLLAALVAPPLWASASSSLLQRTFSSIHPRPCQISCYQTAWLHLCRHFVAHLWHGEAWLGFRRDSSCGI